MGWVDQQGQPQSGSSPLNFQSALALASCDALGGDYRSALPVAASVDLIFNFTLVHGDIPDQPGDVPITFADIRKAKRLLGYSPKVSIREGLRQFVAWYRQNRE